MKESILSLAVLIGGMVIAASVGRAAVPQLINYQGRLTETNGTPVADRNYLIKFRIYASSNGSDSLWSSGFRAVTVSDGLFNYALGDSVAFPADLFNGDTLRFLGIQVQADPEITPRTRFVTVPYSFRVYTVDGATGGIISGDVSIQSDLSVSGKATIGPGHTSTGTHAFVAGANNIASGDTTTVSGGEGNIASELGATIGGGRLNEANGQYATIAGGNNNAAWTSGSVGGGTSNEANGAWATVSGGMSNISDGDESTISGGTSNSATGEKSSVGGGLQNSATGRHSTIPGGVNNLAFGTGATIGGGRSNIARGSFSVVSGGGGQNTADSNLAGGNLSAIGGGKKNIASGDTSTIGGGINNIASGVGSSIGGGANNNALADYATVGGGFATNADAPYATVSGGNGNTARDNWATVSGGKNNHSRAEGSYVGGGAVNSINGTYSSVLGGSFNRVDGSHSLIAGGTQNIVEGDFSAVLGGAFDTITSSADFSYLFGFGSKLTSDSTFMVDMPHILFGDESTGYEVPAEDGTAGQVLTTDGAGQANWQTPTASITPPFPYQIQFHGNIFNYYNHFAAGTGQPVLTVPVSSTLYITSITVVSPAAGVVGDFELDGATILFFRTLDPNWFSWSSGGAAPLLIESGQSLRVSTNNNADITITGYLF